MRVKVDVKPRDITKGVRRSYAHCPVAIAARRQVMCDEVLGTMIVLDDGVIIKAPRSVSDFVCAFDHNDPVEPFSFTINVPKKYVKVKS